MLEEQLHQPWTACLAPGFLLDVWKKSLLLKSLFAGSSVTCSGTRTLTQSKEICFYSTKVNELVTKAEASSIISCITSGTQQKLKKYMLVSAIYAPLSKG